MDDRKKAEIQCIGQAYLALLRLPIGELRMSLQAELCTFRDTLANLMGLDEETVQNLFEELRLEAV